MKRHFLLAVLISLLVCSCTTEITKSNFDKYAQALKFLREDSLSISLIRSNFNLDRNQISYIISPKIIPPYLSAFSNYAIKNKLDFTLNDRRFFYNDSITVSLIKYEQELEYQPYLKHGMAEINYERKGNVIVFFSKTYDNFLTASVHFYRSENSIEYKPDFGTSIEYLFIFKDNYINNVLIQTVSNN